MTTLAHLAAMVHGGVLVAFALLLANRARIPHVREEDLVRVFRACGAILGLSLGAFLLGELWTWPALHNAGATGLDRWAVPRGETLRVLLFGTYWVGYVVLEVWTLDPCRLLDSDGLVTDRPAYASAVRAVARQVAVNATLFTLVVGLE
jgi:hypothetical protein